VRRPAARGRAQQWHRFSALLATVALLGCADAQSDPALVREPADVEPARPDAMTVSDAQSTPDVGSSPADATSLAREAAAPEVDARPVDEDGARPDALPSTVDATPSDDARPVTDGAVGGNADASPPCGAPDAAVEVRVGAGFEGEAACGPLRYFAVAAAGVTLRLSARDVPPGAEVVVTDPRGTALGETLADDRGVFDVQVTTVGAGELRWSITAPPEAPPTRLRGSLVCVAECGREATRYPIVLLHGMAGTDRYFGLLDYFYDIVPLLSGRGFSVSTPVVPPIGSSADRANVLAPQIDAVLAETGAAKVHLVAHSQGGLDARILVSGLGYADRVASITTISSPHAGIPIEIPEWLAGEDFSRDGMVEFARRYPDVEAMPRFSWAGRTCSRLDAACREENDDEVVELVLGASHALMSAAAQDDGDHGENDGVVLVSSARWGEFLGVFPADHFDEVGQIADAVPAPFDHRGFYLSEARRLRVLEQTLGL
jgi:triacylglycerol lipase